MKTTIDKLWKHAAGLDVTIDGVRYLYCGRDRYERMVMLYNYETDAIMYQDDFDYNAPAIVGDTINYDTLITVKAKEILKLLDDGWEKGDDDKFNLNPYFSELKVIIELKQLVDNGKN